MCCVSLCCFLCFFFKQKTAYEMRISDWSSDVCSSDLHILESARLEAGREARIDAGIGAELIRRYHSRIEAFIDRAVVDHEGNGNQRHARPGVEALLDGALFVARVAAAGRQIGRASGRERVCPYV